MLSQITIGRRLVLGFGIVLLFLLGVAGVGQWALRTSVRTAVAVLDVDVAASDHSQSMRAAVLDMRRFEKDLFLNIGNDAKESEYSAKWEAARSTTEQALTALDRLIEAGDDTEKISSIRADVSAYAAGFQEVSRQIASKTILD